MKGMKRMNKKAAAIILSSLTAVSAIFTGAGMVPAAETAKTAAASETENSSEAENSSETEQVSETSENAEMLTEEEFYNQINEFADKFAEYSAGDLENFKTLYVSGTSEETIENEYQSLGNYDMSEFDRKNILKIDENNGIYIMNIVYYKVKDESLDNWVSYLAPLTLDNGEWKVDYSQEALDYANEVIYTDGTYFPSGYVEAARAGRNVLMFDSTNFLYLNSYLVYSGCSEYSVKFIWQEEGGGLIIYLWLVNGTSQPVHYTDGQLELSDDSLGQILACTFTLDETLQPGTSELVSLPVPADAEGFKTGTQAWSGVTYQMLLNSEAADGDEAATEGENAAENTEDAEGENAEESTENTEGETAAGGTVVESAAGGSAEEPQTESSGTADIER